MSTEKQPPTPATYQIRTLQDIFNLPTSGQMERCLKELGEIMVSTRAYVELLKDAAQVAAAEALNEPLPEGMPFSWPEVSTWTDDGGLAGSEIKFVAMEDPKQELMSITYTKREGSS